MHTYSQLKWEYTELIHNFGSTQLHIHNLGGSIQLQIHHLCGTIQQCAHNLGGSIRLFIQADATECRF